MQHMENAFVSGWPLTLLLKPLSIVSAAGTVDVLLSSFIRLLLLVSNSIRDQESSSHRKVLSVGAFSQDDWCCVCEGNYINIKEQVALYVCACVLGNRHVCVVHVPLLPDVRLPPCLRAGWWGTKGLIGSQAASPRSVGAEAWQYTQKLAR